jgi:hypothetical protein
VHLQFTCNIEQPELRLEHTRLAVLLEDRNTRFVSLGGSAILSTRFQNALQYFHYVFVEGVHVGPSSVQNSTSVSFRPLACMLSRRLHTGAFPQKCFSDSQAVRFCIRESWVKQGRGFLIWEMLLTCELQVYLSSRRKLSLCRENQR